MDERILDKLYEPFQLKERVGQANKIFKYVPSADIIDRMNRVFKGNWSTEVISSQILEDEVLLCVRVLVRDDDGNMYYHDGYASQMILRYTYGDKEGKAVNIGNTFKSAMSKAIKTAVAKWGVGLDLSDDGESSTDSTFEPPISMPVANNQNQTQQVIGAPVGVEIPHSTPINNTDTPVTNNPLPQDVPINNNTPTVANNPLPPAFVDTSDSSGVSAPTPQESAPVIDAPINAPPIVDQPTVENVEPTAIPAAPEQVLNTPPVEVIGSESDQAVTMLTDVQKIAIEQTMSINNFTFEELAAKALGRTDNLPKSIDELTYSDAVKLIQHGNDLRPVI